VIYDPTKDAQLFDIEEPPPVSLADRFGVPPFSILDRRQGEWQDRKRRWLSLGIESEKGRADLLLSNASNAGWGTGFVSEQITAQGVTSVFDPVLCELAYRWFSREGDRVLDPFAGGSVRGVVASTLARWYVGVDLRSEQVEANEAQAHLGSDIAPRWIQGDSARLGDHLDAADEFDFIFSCPPYADLEVYSDNPRDLSTMPYDEFRETHGVVIEQAAKRLRGDRFAAWVVSDVRDKRGSYRGLVGHTVEAFQSAGLDLYNDAVILDPVGTVRLRAGNLFTRTRKLSRLHQHLLVFAKGDGKRAARRLAAVDLPSEVAS
jgi:16S rRNA G966 N2-methylase RsmD